MTLRRSLFLILVLAAPFLACFSQSGVDESDVLDDTGATRNVAEEAFEAYRACSRRLAEAETPAEVFPCYSAEGKKEILASAEELAPLYGGDRDSSLLDIAHAHPTTLVLVGAVPPDESVSVSADTRKIELWVRGDIGRDVTAVRAELRREAGEWRIAREEMTIETGVLRTPEGMPALAFYVTLDGERVLDTRNAVISEANVMGYPTFIVIPLFEGPILQIDNLNPDSKSQPIARRTPDEIQADPTLVSLAIEGEGIPDAGDISGDLVLSTIQDGRASGELGFSVNYFMLDRPIEGAFAFENLPLSANAGP